MNIIEQLYERRSFGIKPGLERERAILEQLGNPHDAYSVIHVAGTNGKGSVCAMLESVLLRAGLRVGLYTSPHLVRFNERIRVCGSPVGDEELSEVLEVVEAAASLVTGGNERDATFFECATAIGFEVFRRNNIEVAIIETGMGGRLDATNVVKPIVTAITNISLEHAEYLGSDLASIATEKAGIIKKGCPLVTGLLDDEAQNVVDGVVLDRSALSVKASDAVSVRILNTAWIGQKVNVSTDSEEYGTILLPLIGEHQVQNMAVAVAVLEVFQNVSGCEIAKEDVRKGLAGVKWLGRCQVLNDDPPMIIDGAHNAEGGRALAGTMKRQSKGKPVGMIIGMCDDKDVHDFLSQFSNIISKVWVVPLENERNMSESVISNVCRVMNLPVSCLPLKDALAESKRWAKESDAVVCITGSLFLVGDVLSLQ